MLAINCGGLNSLSNMALGNRRDGRRHGPPTNIIPLFAHRPRSRAESSEASPSLKRTYNFFRLCPVSRVSVGATAAILDASPARSPAYFAIRQFRTSCKNESTYSLVREPPASCLCSRCAPEDLVLELLRMCDLIGSSLRVRTYGPRLTVESLVSPQTVAAG